MTSLTYYCSADDVRRWMGITSADISDADAIELIKLAEAEVDALTHTTFLVVQDSGTATSGDATTVTNSGATWTVDEWNSDANLVNGYAVWIFTGTNSGEIRTITDNSETALTVSPSFSAAIDNTSQYRIIKNTYVNETFTGDGEKIYYTDKYPLMHVSSLTIDSTSNTISSLYKVDEWGKLELSSSSESSIFADRVPLLNNAKYYYGVYPVQALVRDLCAVTAGLMVAVNRVGGTYTFATSYSVPDLSVVKGVPYPHFEKVANSLQNKRDWMIATLLPSIVRPMFGDIMTGAGDIGIAVTDFTNNALTDFGVTVSWENVTKTTHNVTGDETLSYAAGVNKTVVLVKRTQRYSQTTEGLVDLGDAIMLAELGEGMAKDDRITYESEKFIIRSVIRRRANGVDLFDTCTLIKVEE